MALIPSYTLLEQLVVLVTAALGYVGLASPLFGTRHARYSAIAATLLSLIVSIILYKEAIEKGPITLFDNNMILDGFAAALVLAASLTLLIDLVAAIAVVEKWDTGSAFYAITALNLLGVYAIALAGSLVLVYTAWILAAVSSYVIIALWKNETSAEAAAKYAAIGVLATSLLIYALCFNIEISGSVYLSGAARHVPLIVAGAATLLPLAAIGFKMGVVPFHMWLPDVYGNARPFLVSVIASQAKILAVAFLLRLLYTITRVDPNLLLVLAGILAVATMTLGNVAALAANDARLVMAYSAIGQAGYIIAGFAALRPGLEGILVPGIFLQVFGYSLAKTSAFLVLDAVYEKAGWEVRSIEVLRGLYKGNKMAALSMLLALLVLVGMPPSLGFWGKLYILYGVASVDLALAIIFVLNMAIAAYYYMMLGWRLFATGDAPKLETDTRIVAASIGSILAFALGIVYWLFASVYVSATPP
ncbi:NADH/Ubiquinone/plastoquinone (complex I) [Pyrolobus fumarii 1A]|uniref:NADH/Ubiquinone/plastoquinone (Complex I) n=1 Tax=Pyrolobus fumarii (strain DSM 11204 / 1A) TaxID=694429 RepID=G0ED49_PYRF1|nr:proton-conducting transporter membrane subunit [Pyrolobus fumarii]AEM39727.1 NADH/Ubiquinone/plastoquinone (complex I) [Pyrolobus fumarii 1A]